MDQTVSEGVGVAFLEDIIESLDAVVYVVDIVNGKYEWGNGKYFDIFGYSRQEVPDDIHEFAQEYFHPEDIEIVHERVRFFKEHLDDAWAGVYRVKHKKGHWIWIYSKLKVFKKDKNGNPTHLLGITIDASNNFETIEKASILFKERALARNQNVISKISDREHEIIRYIAAGLTYKEIAKKLSIAPDTVNKHRKNILDKLDMKNVASLVNFAKASGMV